MSNCAECEMAKEMAKDKRREDAKKQALHFGKENSLNKIVFYQRKNGSFSYCTESEWSNKSNAFTLLEVLFIH